MYFYNDRKSAPISLPTNTHSDQLQSFGICSTTSLCNMGRQLLRGPATLSLERVACVMRNPWMIAYGSLISEQLDQGLMTELLFFVVILSFCSKLAAVLPCRPFRTTHFFLDSYLLLKICSCPRILSINSPWVFFFSHFSDYMNFSWPIPFMLKYIMKCHFCYKI